MYLVSGENKKKSFEVSVCDSTLMFNLGSVTGYVSGQVVSCDCMYNICNSSKQRKIFSLISNSYS